MEKNLTRRILAMYDTRGIQNYVYRNPLVKDAMGASALIDGIVEKALNYAVNNIPESDCALEWVEKDKNKTWIRPLPFSGDSKKIVLLFSGGGNAFVLFESEDTFRTVNQKMAKYILEHTYSLHLAVSHIWCTGNYSKDYANLNLKMTRVKADMSQSMPLGALPVEQIEIKTGYPLVNDKGSMETFLKEEYKKKAVPEGDEKFLENLGSDIAVVHIDGNNMGLRIRLLIQDIDDYTEAINKMRRISFNISTAYSGAFEKMRANQSVGQGRMIRKVITAGDDITYVCSACIALKSVTEYVHLLAGKSLKDIYGVKTTEADIKNYGLSVCAGIAYCHNHFPFSIAYDVAEACCDSAKARAKNEDNKDGDRIGNFVDFQVCKDVRTRDLDKTRAREYMTADGDNLLMRPYYIETGREDDALDVRAKNKPYRLNTLMDNIKYFNNEENIPRGQAKDLRNTYPLGEKSISDLAGFLSSRGRKLPNGDLMGKDSFWVNVNGKNTAKYYDALELMDIEKEGSKDE